MDTNDVLSVRRAKPGDLSCLAGFTIAQVHEGEGAIKAKEVVEDAIRRGLADESLALYWVLVDSTDTPVGGASITQDWSDWNDGFYWWLQSMYVLPMQRGKGGMRMLLGAIKEEMARRNGIELRIYVNKDNRAAKSAYERSGFRLSVYEVMVLVDDV